MLELQNINKFKNRKVDQIVNINKFILVFIETEARLGAEQNIYITLSLRDILAYM